MRTSDLLLWQILPKPQSDASTFLLARLCSHVHLSPCGTVGNLCRRGVQGRVVMTNRAHTRDGCAKSGGVGVAWKGCRRFSTSLGSTHTHTHTPTHTDTRMHACTQALTHHATRAGVLMWKKLCRKSQAFLIFLSWYHIRSHTLKTVNTHVQTCNTP